MEYKPTEPLEYICKHVADLLAQKDNLNTNLIRIVLEDMSTEDKINKLRKAILEHRAQKQPDQDLIYSKLTGSNTQTLELIDELVRVPVSLIKLGNELFQKIADVIRDEKMTPDQKVEKISNLLM